MPKNTCAAAGAVLALAAISFAGCATQRYETPPPYPRPIPPTDSRDPEPEVATAEESVEPETGIEHADASADASVDADDKATVDLLPFLSTNRVDPGSRSLDGAYVRLLLTTTLPEQGQADRRGETIASRSYRDESRPYWQRWLVGRSLTRVASVKVTLNAPNVSITRALASAAHLSNREDGETWTTIVNDDRSLTPWFRVDPATTATLQTSLNATSEIKGRMTGEILNVILEGAKLATPSARLVTNLNEERFGRAADYFDRSLSELFGEAIIEETTTDIHFNRLPNGDALMTIDPSFPLGRGDLVDLRSRGIGTWTVELDQALVSIFHSTPFKAASGAPARVAPCDTVTDAVDGQACLAYRGLSPYAVLEFPVGEDLSLSQSLAGEAGFAAALKRLEDAAVADKAGPALAVCDLVASHAWRVGLNRYDVAATVWAFSRSGGLSAESSTALAAADRCEAVALAKRVKLLA